MGEVACQAALADEPATFALVELVLNPWSCDFRTLRKLIDVQGSGRTLVLG